MPKNDEFGPVPLLLLGGGELLSCGVETPAHESKLASNNERTNHRNPRMGKPHFPMQWLRG
jgi:hypothetical protein